MSIERLEARTLLSASDVPIVPAGSVDPTFGTEGFAGANVSVLGAGGALALQPSGDIIADVQRFNPDGTPDPTYPARSPNHPADTVVAAPDGRLLLIAHPDFSNPLAPDPMSLLDPDGQADPSFGRNGQVSIPFSVTDAKFDAQGKIIVAGYNDTGISIMRYTPSGAPDSAFGVAGQVVIPDQTKVSAIPDAIVAQPDGRIIIAIATASQHVRENLARLNRDGSPDTTFGQGGRILTDLPTGGSPPGLDVRPFIGIGAKLALQPNGQILLGGQSNSGFILQRFSSAGTPDMTFGRRGRAVVPFSNPIAAAMAVRPDGEIAVVIGRQGGHPVSLSAPDNHRQLAVSWLKPSGRLDRAVHGGRWSISQLAIHGQGPVLAATFEADGKLIVLDPDGYRAPPELALSTSLMRFLAVPTPAAATRTARRLNVFAASGTDRVSITTTSDLGVPDDQTVAVTVNDVTYRFTLPTARSSIQIIWPGHGRVTILAPISGTVQHVFELATSPM